MPRCLVLPDVSPGRLLLAELLVPDQLEGTVEGRLVVAGVEREAGDGLVRELVRLDVVATADLVGPDADRGGQRVHGPLDGVGRLGPAGAAVRVGRRLAS